MPKLTKQRVEAAQPGPKPSLLWDDAVKGFGLLVSPGGAKSYVFQYRPERKSNTGPRPAARRMKLGAASVLDVDDARKKARAYAGQVADGKDPAADKDAAKAEQTVSAFMATFLSDYVAKHNKPSTQRTERGLIERHITGRKSDDPKRRVPETALGKLKLSELTTPRIKAWHKAIKSDVSANRALAHLSRACVVAVGEGLLPSNPCAKIIKNPEKACTRTFDDAELIRIGQALRELVEERKLLPTVALGIRLLAVTGLRPGEVRLAKWTDYKPQLRKLDLQDSKTGARPVRLAPQAVALLDAAMQDKAMRIGPYIVAGSDPENPILDVRWSQLVQAVLRRANVADAHPHVFRHCYATFSAEHGATAAELMAGQGWKTMAMAQRYVSLAGVGDHRHPLPAAARISLALDGVTNNVLPFAVAS